MCDSDDDSTSCGDVDEGAHQKFIADVRRLSTRQHVSHATRTEPAFESSEYNLVKTAKNVHLGDLANLLGRKGKQLDIARQLKHASQKAVALPKPLETVAAERIRRDVAYAKTQRALTRWEPIVASMRSATHAAFPLHCDAKVKTEAKAGEDWGCSNELQKELLALQPPVEVYDINLEANEATFALSGEEMAARRLEASKLRAAESYKIAAARRRNKIKSKKYHRLQKREKLKADVKQFEALQKINPEAALEKLKEIERARAVERMTLRHRNTGQWAKSKLIRAKYDKSTRQELAQQLAISVGLTQTAKALHEQVEDDDDCMPDAVALEERRNEDVHNPWLTTNSSIAIDNNGSMQTANIESINGSMWEVDAVAAASSGTELMNPPNLDWVVTCSSNEDIKEDGYGLEAALRAVDRKFQLEVSQRFASLSKPTAVVGSHVARKLSKHGACANTFAAAGLDPTRRMTRSQRPIIDAPLEETTTADAPTTTLSAVQLVSLAGTLNEKSPPTTVTDVDPNPIRSQQQQQQQFRVPTALPDLSASGDNEEPSSADFSQLMLEAFQDDDVVDAFRDEKHATANSETPIPIDQSLPGWGTWGGQGVSLRSRKRKRFSECPARIMRKDAKKDNLMINERANEKARLHLVSDIPFPFRNVRDFEASVRAPIGNTFVPETACRRLVEPAVVTKLGAVIKPMTEDILIAAKATTGMVGEL